MNRSRICRCLVLAAAWILMLSLWGPVSSFADTKTAGKYNPDFKSVDKMTLYSSACNRYASQYKHYYASKANRFIRMFNKAIDALDPHVPAYLYFVESSRSHPMKASFSESSDYYNYLCDRLHVDEHDHLKYSTFEQFCDYFYATDHHWNHRGAYQGYVDIVRMLFGDQEEVHVPDEEVVLPVLFNGSFAKNHKNPCSTEHFSLYRFSDLQPYTSYINGRQRRYDRIQSYLKGRYSKDVYANHYQSCYGGNYACLVMETGLADKPNLLLFTNSMGAGVKYLLAKHFNRIVSIDLRYYKKEFRQDLSLQEAVKEYRIDMILILGENVFFSSAKNLVP